ncbi:uncharacterized protein PG986_002334 [Apiospora aurea]|uniref:DUF7918 domain-containing protein n=1 Tax=Apiospora aurea TaxID=335848 RepID=A0ABR1R018_9PEZI
MAPAEAPKGLTCWVEVDGKRAMEYNAPTQADDSDIREDYKDVPRLVKYIEAIHGKYFSVHAKKESPFNRRCDHLGLQFGVDTHISEVLHEPKTKESQGQPWITKMEGFDSKDGEGEWHDHYFKFSDIVVVEDYDAPDQALEDGTSKPKTWGLIRAYFFRMSKSAIKKREDYGEAPSASLTKEVSKKILKDSFLTTMSTYETNVSEKPDGADMKQEDIFCNGRDRPFFIFEFRYHNKENPDDARAGVHGAGPSRKKVKVKESVRDDGIAQLDLLSDDDDDD